VFICCWCVHVHPIDHLPVISCQLATTEQQLTQMLPEDHDDGLQTKVQSASHSVVWLPLNQGTRDAAVDARDVDVS